MNPILGRGCNHGGISIGHGHSVWHLGHSGKRELLIDSVVNEER